MSDPSSQPTQPLTDAELARIDKICEGGWTPAGLDQGRLWVTLTRHREANQVLEQATIAAVKAKDAMAAEVDRLRAENTALREARDGECPRCRFPVWSHDLWKCIPWDMGEYVGDDELRREVVLRELNQGALAGMSSEVTVQAADLVLAALNRYDAWRAEPDPRALGLDQDGRGQ